MLVFCCFVFWLVDSIRDIPGIIYPGSQVRNPTRELAKKIYLGNRVEKSTWVNWETQYEVGEALKRQQRPSCVFPKHTEALLCARETHRTRPVCFPSTQKRFCVLGKHTGCVLCVSQRAPRILTALPG